MTSVNRKLPVGIQDFESLRKGQYVYVDKTEYIYRLVHSGKPYFLSRPRRFGKSLFLSTLKAYFEGKRELFKGLRIEELEGDDPDSWQSYPVFYFDLNKKNYKADHALEEVLAAHLIAYEKIYRDENKACPLEERFQRILVSAVEQSERKNPIPLFYQTGYLTIKGYDEEFRSYALGYPNEEVEYGFLKSLAPYYLHA